MARNIACIERIGKGIVNALTVSKVEIVKIRFTGWDIEKYEDVIKVLMMNYAQSLMDITEIWKTYRGSNLSSFSTLPSRNLM